MTRSFASQTPWDTIANSVEMRAMLRARDERKLVELKAVDAAWPLVGEAVIEGADTLQEGIATGQALLQPSLMRSLNIAIGDEVRLGEATLIVAGTLTHRA